MGTYISQSDVEDVHGLKSVAIWSNLKGGRITDTTRVARAIAWAEAFINARFRGSRYAVPITPVSTLVVDWTAKLAGVWLYRNRGQRDSDDDTKLNNVQEEAVFEMSQVLAGVISLDDEHLPQGPHVAV